MYTIKFFYNSTYTVVGVIICNEIIKLDPLDFVQFVFLQTYEIDGFRLKNGVHIILIKF